MRWEYSSRNLLKSSRSVINFFHFRGTPSNSLAWALLGTGETGTWGSWHLPLFTLSQCPEYSQHSYMLHFFFFTFKKTAITSVPILECPLYVVTLLFLASSPFWFIFHCRVCISNLSHHSLGGRLSLAPHDWKSPGLPGPPSAAGADLGAIPAFGVTCTHACPPQVKQRLPHRVRRDDHDTWHVYHVCHITENN